MNTQTNHNTIDFLRSHGKTDQAIADYLLKNFAGHFKIDQLPALNLHTAATLVFLATKPIMPDDRGANRVTRLIDGLPDGTIRYNLDSIWQGAPEELQEQAQLFCIQYGINWPSTKKKLAARFPLTVPPDEMIYTFRDRNQLTIAPCTV